MGVPMVQTKKRRSSLVMGLLLAVLLGVAAAFFVLAMPIHMLETVTTLTRLSKLMVQAEPPISPNDRTLLAVLAGILTAGVGWVLVDWLLFGRAGMSTLIRTREDDYEDEDDDAYRPTDPLDLVTPMAARGHDWSQDAAGDTRRPLSARNDIGEPSPFAPPPPFGTQPAMPAVNPALTPFGQILPGAGVSAPPLQPHVPPLGQPAAPPPAPNWAVPAGETGIAALNANFDLPDRPAGFPAAIPGAPTTSAPPTPVAPPANMPSWLPAPGARADAVPAFGSLSPAPPAVTAPSASTGPAEPPAASPDPFAAMPSAPPPIVPTMAEPPQLILSRPAPPLPFAEPQPQTPPPPPVAPAAPAEQRPYFTAGSSVPPGVVAPAPPIAAPAPVPVPPPVAAPVIQAPTAAPVAPAPPVAQRPAIDPGVDRARLQDLLAQLEAKVHSRRAAAPAPAAPAGTFAPAASAPAPAPAPIQPQRVEPPAGFAAPPPQMQPPLPVPPAAPVYELPPAQPSPAFNLGIQPQLQPEGPATMPTAAANAPIPLARIDDGGKDELLDQPLHVTLDLLRNMVRR